jgi:hypothetical protein
MATDVLFPPADAADSSPGSSIGETPRPSIVALSATKARELEQEVVEYCSQLYDQATEDRDYQREVRETFRTIEYLEGNQWGAKARYARHRPVLNVTRRHFWESVGLLTDLSLDFQVKLFDKLNSYSAFEKMLNQLAVRWAQANQYEDRQYDVVLYGLLHTGPAKIQWNSRLNGGLGDVQMVPVAPWQWACLGAGTDPQDSECVLYYPVVTRDEIARRFGKQLAERVDYDLEYSGQLGGQFQRPAKISSDAWNRMGNAMRTSLGVRQSRGANDSIYPMTALKEFWLRDASVNESSETVTVGPADNRGKPLVNWAYRVEPGEALYPRGRLIGMAGGVVLEDTCNPYWHAKFPFPVFRPFRVPWKLSGDPVARSWMQMNNSINRIFGGMLDALNSVVEPTLVAPKGAFPPADWDALDPGAAGGKIKYNNNAPRPPEFAKRAEFPYGPALTYVQEIEKELSMSSGNSAISQAMNKKQVPGGDSLEMILNSRSLPIKVQTKSLASFIEDGGGMVISDMLQFYSLAHRVNILGPAGIAPADYRPVYGEALPAGMEPETFVRKFSGIIRRDTLLQSQKDAKIQQAFQLLKMGVLSVKRFMALVDDNFPYEQNRSELLEEAKTKMIIAAAAAALQGKSGGKRPK